MVPCSLQNTNKSLRQGKATTITAIEEDSTAPASLPRRSGSGTASLYLRPSPQLGRKWATRAHGCKRVPWHGRYVHRLGVATDGEEFRPYPHVCKRRSRVQRRRFFYAWLLEVALLVPFSFLPDMQLTTWTKTLFVPPRIICGIQTNSSIPPSAVSCIITCHLDADVATGIPLSRASPMLQAYLARCVLVLCC